MSKVYVTALSMGGGVQTASMALMLAEGRIDSPAPDVMVFADTQAEPPHVYETLDWLESLLPWPLVRATLGDLHADTIASIEGQPPSYRRGGGNRKTDLPLFGQGGGMASRQCTQNYKIHVIKRTVREWAGECPPRLAVVQYLGISLDEYHRVKPSREKYITNAYPLIDAGLKRSDCLAYLDERYPGHPVGKSACFFCPFHGPGQWRELLNRYPDMAEEAAQMDDRLRASPHRLSLVRWEKGGLRNVLREYEAQGRLELDGFGNECAGVCGV